MNILRFAYVATSLLALSVPAAHAQQQGGVIKIATIGEPASLDPMMSATDLVGMISQHIFETLFTFDSKWNVTPLLAQSMPEVSSNGTIYTIKLRQDIKFHDGREMMANDVVASLKRWLDVASRGKQTAVYIKSVEKTANDTVTITLTQPYAPLLSLLAFNNSAAVIMPSDALTMPLKEVIGTGPYKLKEHKADQYIQLIRFDDYKPRSEKADGFGGARIAKADEILFAPLPDANTRIEAAISGQYDYVDSLPVESYQRLEQGKDKPVLLDHFGWPIFVMNNKDGPLKSAKIRKAIQLALNEEDMLAAGFGDPKFYAAEPAMYPKGYAWHTTTGTENYNLADPEKAKALLDEAGYDGTPIRILTSRQYEFHYKMAQVAAEYLKLAGFKVDLQVVDWATLTQRRADPKLWDIYITHSPFLPEPALIGSLSTSSPGWWDTPARKTVVDAFTSESNPEKRVALWADVQKTIYDELPLIKIGDFNAVAAMSTKLEGVDPAPWPYFWNASLKK